MVNAQVRDTSNIKHGNMRQNGGHGELKPNIIKTRDKAVELQTRVTGR